MEVQNAVLQNDIEALRKLFKKGNHRRSKSYLTAYDQDGLTPMANAIKHNRFDIVKLLLDAYKEAKLDINTRDKNGYTILHLAVQSNEKVLMTILQCEGIDVNVENGDKNRPLHYFCQAYKSPDCSKPFRQLLDKGCEVNAQNRNGETALHKSIFNSAVRLLMVDLLLKNGADVNVVNSQGESALHYAVRLGRDDLVTLLLKAGADVTIQGKARKTPFQLAIQEHREDIADRIGMHEELLEWLHDQGLDACAPMIAKEELYLDVLVDAEEAVLSQLFAGMGISAGHQIKLMKAVKLLKDSMLGAEFPTASTESSDSYDEETMLDSRGRPIKTPHTFHTHHGNSYNSSPPPDGPMSMPSLTEHFGYNSITETTPFSSVSKTSDLSSNISTNSPTNTHTSVETNTTALTISPTTSPTTTSAPTTPTTSRPPVPRSQTSRNLPAGPSNSRMDASDEPRPHLTLSRSNSPSSIINALRSQTQANPPPVNPSPELSRNSQTQINTAKNSPPVIEYEYTSITNFSPLKPKTPTPPIIPADEETVAPTIPAVAPTISVVVPRTISVDPRPSTPVGVVEPPPIFVDLHPSPPTISINLQPAVDLPPVGSVESPPTISVNLTPRELPTTTEDVRAETQPSISIDVPATKSISPSTSNSTFSSISDLSSITNFSFTNHSITNRSAVTNLSSISPPSSINTRSSTSTDSPTPTISATSTVSSTLAPSSISTRSSSAPSTAATPSTLSPPSSLSPRTSPSLLAPGKGFIRGTSSRDNSAMNLNNNQPVAGNAARRRGQYRASVIRALTDSLTQLKHSGRPAPLFQNSEIEFTGKLGAGSSGKVYKGLYKGNMVAIKVLKNMLPSEEEEGILEFRKEFEIMSAIQTQHAVNFYGAVLEPKICMVMEYCARGSLYHVLNSVKYNVGWEQLFHYAIETTTAIKELHDLKPQIVHRDIKSLNFLVTDDFNVKVCDFGLSRFNTGSNLSTLQRLRGTYAYCAPEVYNTELFSTKSDVYSIGIVFWELVTRCIRGHYERPYSEYKNLMFDFQIIIQAAKMGLRPTIPETCPEGWKKLILSCMDGTAENRPTCDQILLILAELSKEWSDNKPLWEEAILKPT